MYYMYIYIYIYVYIYIYIYIYIRLARGLSPPPAVAWRATRRHPDGSLVPLRFVVILSIQTYFKLRASKSQDHCLCSLQNTSNLPEAGPISPD